MSNKKRKNLSIEQLIQRARERKDGYETPKKTLYIKSLDSEIVVEKPEADIIDEALEMKGRGADKYLVYNSVIEPNLKDKELQKAYGVIEPYDIVEEIFQLGEISKIGTKILELAGYGDSVEEIKN